MSPQLERHRRAYRRYAQEVIEAYVEIAREIMLQHWKPNSCIAATAVTVNVLKAYRLPARPFAVITTLHNQAWNDLAVRLGRAPAVEEFGESGAWAIGLGVAPRPGDPPDTESQYGGHLVALALNDQLLIDASVDQASRPERGIEIPAKVLVAGITPAWVTADPMGFDGVIAGTTEDGTVTVTYRRRDDPPDWTQAPDWRPYKHGHVELAIFRRLLSMGIRPLEGGPTARV